MSQNYPNPYPVAYQCSWNLAVGRFYQISLEAVDFDIGSGSKDTECFFKVWKFCEKNEVGILYFS